jgi:hypothetical protein
MLAFTNLWSANTLTLHVSNAALTTTKNHGVGGFAESPNGNEGESEFGGKQDICKFEC